MSQQRPSALTSSGRRLLQSSLRLCTCGRMCAPCLNRNRRQGGQPTAVCDGAMQHQVLATADHTHTPASRTLLHIPSSACLPPCAQAFRLQPVRAVLLKAHHRSNKKIESWHTTTVQDVPLARRFALVPLGPPSLSYSSTCKALFKHSGDEVQLTVDRDYKAGALLRLI